MSNLSLPFLPEQMWYCRPPGRLRGNLFFADPKHLLLWDVGTKDALVASLRCNALLEVHCILR